MPNRAARDGYIQIIAKHKVRNTIVSDIAMRAQAFLNCGPETAAAEPNYSKRSSVSDS